MLSDPTIFVVEDDEGAAASLTALLSTMDLIAETFESAEAFLAAYDGRPSACLLLDMRLPTMSGLELQQELKARGQHIPIVMISGHADHELSNKALEHGAVAYLEKPYAGDELESVIQAALSSAEAAPE